MREHGLAEQFRHEEREQRMTDKMEVAIHEIRKCSRELKEIRQQIESRSSSSSSSDDEGATENQQQLVPNQHTEINTTGVAEETYVENQIEPGYEEELGSILLTL